jgi:hypothetical protein
LVFIGDVFGELALREISFARKASCGVMLPGIEDDVNGLGDDPAGLAPARWSEPEPCTLTDSWRCRRISRISARVV